ncbi:MAG: glutamine synthetase family protein [Rhizobiaceae bacterium]|nr:glutamine synthetase family protein [Rhizobiaceae bacterium]
MKSAEEVLKAVTDNNIDWVRIVFVDQHGVTRGKTLAATALKSAFAKGVSMTSTLLLKDTSHTTVFPVWENDAGFGAGVMTGASDFLMKPDAQTFRILPWLENTGWLLSDISMQEGSEIEISTRHILRKTIDRLAERELEFICGLEVEFYVLKIDDARLEHENSNRPHDPPQTSLLSHGYQYLTENRVDELAQVMELIQANAAALELPLLTIESEFGPSQFEVTFEPMKALKAADMMVLFRNMVKQVCRRHGYHATFMCRPGFKNSMGSGWHLHQSLVDIKTGENRFVPKAGRELTPLASQWIGGILARANESCILTTPTVNGYKRYQPFALAPDRVQWGHDNRGAMLRALMNEGDSASRLENRVGEPAANPYLYIASQILCGLGGINENMTAPQPVERPYAGDAQKLPGNLADAMAAFDNSAFFRKQLGDEFVDYFIHLKCAEWQRYLGAVSEWEQREYFSLF